MNKFKEEIIKSIKKEVKKVDIQLEVPPKSDMGDYAFPCFSAAKVLKKSPHEIANELQKKIKKGRYIKQTKVIGPYINFFINKRALTKETITRVLKEKDNYGSSNIGKNKKIILEHTSINPNASPHVGRARNALIGDSIVRILRANRYRVEVHYYVNDIGKQISMLVLAAKDKKNIKFNDLLKMYMDISKKIEESPELEKKVFLLLNKLEKRDKKVIREFQRIVSISLKGQLGILSELGIKYDIFDYESSYLWSKKTDKTLKILEKTGKFFFDKDNRFVLDEKGFGLGMKVPVLVLTRSDGTSLYPLRDIAYAIEIAKKGENILILGEDQKLYNEQINAALLILEKKPRKAIYYSFVLLEESKMSTRKGNLILLEEFMAASLKKAEDELKKRNKVIDKKSAKIIGYGALKFGILRINPEKNVNFNWEHALNFEGETAPYIQYAYARINSIKNKYGNPLPKKINFSLLSNKEEIELIKKIASYPEIIEKSAVELRPNTIANYSYELAKQFNEFYHLHNILKEKEEIKKSRLILAECVMQTLKNSLNLLGIEVLERM